jgi:beta-lactamase regulating signal transducer with metallopeptidase domain
MSIEIQLLSQAFGKFLIGILFGSSALIVAGALFTLLLRSRTAEVRHFVWHVILFGLLLLPLIECAAPPIQHPPMVIRPAELEVFTDPLITLSDRRIPTTPGKIIARHSHPFPWSVLVASVYALVTCILLLRLTLSVFRLNLLTNHSEPIFDPDLRELSHEIWLHSLSLYKPRIRVSKEIRVPTAVGIEPITVLLPIGWNRWRRQKLRAALIHEMAHVRRNDPRTTLLASFAVCLFWVNPLVYWLRRQLLATAEEACDEAALLTFSPEEYAQILIEFASNIGLNGSRLAAASAMAVCRSLMTARLEHIFSVHRLEKRPQKFIRTLFVAVFCPTLYLAASVRFAQKGSATDKTTISIASQQQADQLESQLARVPENLKIRGALMAFYANKRNEVRFTPHLLWVINHHPEAPIAALKIYDQPESSSRSRQVPVGVHTDANAEYELVKAAWDGALNRRPHSPDVLFHAGLFVEGSNPRRALDLFRRAATLPAPDPHAESRYLHAISVIYAAAVMTNRSDNRNVRINNIVMDQVLGGALRTEIDASHDPTLLCGVGTILVQLHQDVKGLRLIQKALDLDPTNPAWKEAMDSARAEPIRRQNLRELAGRP